MKNKLKGQLEKYCRKYENERLVLDEIVSIYKPYWICKYNGKNNYSERVAKYLEGHEVIPVCPEVLGGLPTPRDPSEIVSGEVINCKGVNVDRQFREGAEEALRIAKENGIDLAILQSRSPSCGVKQIYDGNFTGKLIPGQGVFAQLLEKNGFRVMDCEEI